MFSGIVESQGVIRQSALSADQFSLKLSVATPGGWDDLRVGDSVAVNGICLTLENPDTSKEMQFSLGAETVKVLGSKGLAMFAIGKTVNLERSLRFGDRIHGHLVSGHVDEVVDILESRILGESLHLKVALPKNPELRPFIWKKGSVTLHGVSLTVNEVDAIGLEVCLIPETQRRTNLNLLQVGQTITLETDWMAKSIIAHRQQKEQSEHG